MNEASLVDLNKRLAKTDAAAGCQSLAVERFRPNLVIDGDSPAYMEDQWDEVIIGNVDFHVTGKYLMKRPCLSIAGILCHDHEIYRCIILCHDHQGISSNTAMINLFRYLRQY